MARIAYDRADAGAFAASRHLSDSGAAAWRDVVARHARPQPGMRLVDVGAGTGSWAAAFTRWFPGVDVPAIEPAAAMRDRCGHRPALAGDATAIPLRAATSIPSVQAAFGAAGFSTVAVEAVPQQTAASLRERPGRRADRCSVSGSAAAPGRRQVPVAVSRW